MNESAGEQITDFLNDELEPQSDNLDITDEADEEPPSRATREGLPRTFRMRHDAHYVEELMARTMEGPVTPVERRARRSPEPPIADTPETFDAPPPVIPMASAAAPTLALVAERLESLVAHATGLRTQRTPAPLVAQSVNAEFARLVRLARAGAILQGSEPPFCRQLLAREIADAAAQASAPIARLSGFDCEVTVDDPAFSIGAEPALVTQTIAGTVDALVELLLSDPRRQPELDARQPAPRIAVNLQCVTVRPALIVDVICPSLFITQAQAERFFENEPGQYARAAAAGILLAGAAHIVRAHGGRADVKRHNGTGVTVTYVFPQVA